jgi:hypothetical protein
VTGARLRVERRNLDGTWSPHSAWYGPQHRDHLERNVRGQETWDPNNSYRLAEESPDTQG